jgi:general secretion pathway protein H
MPQRRRGFTLIEMLVVLMVMGLFVGLVSAIMRPDDRAMLQQEAERLSELLNLASTEAQLSGTPIAWSAEASGYRFWRATEDDLWSEIGSSELLRPRTLPHGMAISTFRVENSPPQGTMRLVFAPRGSALAFTIGISLGPERYSIVGSPIGEIRAVRGESIPNGGLALR